MYRPRNSTAITKISGSTSRPLPAASFKTAYDLSKNARVLFSFKEDDVTGVRFSPSGRFFAALHSSLWKDMAKAQPPGDAWITIHAGEAASFGRSSCDSADDAAFSTDDELVAIRCSSDIDVFEIR